jgi:hypothetical protein
LRRVSVSINLKREVVIVNIRREMKRFLWILVLVA